MYGGEYNGEIETYEIHDGYLDYTPFRWNVPALLEEFLFLLKTYIRRDEVTIDCLHNARRLVRMMIELSLNGQIMMISQEDASVILTARPNPITRDIAEYLTRRGRELRADSGDIGRNTIAADHMIRSVLEVINA